MVDQHQVGAAGLGRGLHLVELAAADQGRVIGPVDAGVDDGRHGGTGRAREVAEFLQRALVRRPTGVGLDQQGVLALAGTFKQRGRHRGPGSGSGSGYGGADPPTQAYSASRSEEHTSELQSLMRISYAVFCLKKKKTEHTA